MDGSFVGRGVELTELDRLLTDTRSGHSRVVSVEGPLGVGKSALVRRFVSISTDLETLWVVCDESESILPFATAGQLARQLRPWAVPDVTQDGHAVCGKGDVFAFGAELLSAIDRLQDQSPVVVVLDSAQWIDDTSSGVLGYVLRRLRAERVLVTLSVRTEGPDTHTRFDHLVPEDQMVRVRLHGLGDREIEDLARRLGMPISRHVAHRIQELTGGNPLRVRKVLEETEEEVLTQDWVPTLPAPFAFRSIILQKAARLSPPTRRLLRAASVLGERCELCLAASLAAVEDPLALVDEAREFGLLRSPGGVPPEIRFADPLVRAAIYHSLDLSERAVLHLAAARHIEDEPAQLRHEVAAATGPDPALAMRLHEHARNELAKRNWGAAAQALAAASRVSSTRAEAERRRLDAVDCLFLAGDLAGARSLAGDLETYSAHPQRAYVMGRMRLVSGDITGALRLFRRARSELDPKDAYAAGRIAAWSAACLGIAGRAAEAAELARRTFDPGSEELIPAPGAMSMCLCALASRGRFQEVMDLVADLPHNPADATFDQFERLVGRGVMRLWSDQVAEGRLDLEASARLGLENGSTTLIPLVLGHLSDADYRLGDWDASVTHADAAITIAEDSGQDHVVGWLHAIASFPCGARGQWSEAEDHLRLAEGAPGGMATRWCAAAARAQLELWRGRAEHAKAALEPLLTAMDEPLQEPGIRPWWLLYAEALTELGNLEQADEVLERTEARIRSRELWSWLVTVARLRGEIYRHAGNTRAALETFATALDGARPGTDRLQFAMLEMAYGASLRQAGQRRSAKLRLEAAKAHFEQLKAAPALARCEAELSAAGLHPVHRSLDAHNRLTSREVTIGHLVVEGLNNREIAAHMVLSPKTVEFHLSNMFSKLNIRSRSQLVRYLLEVDEPHDAALPHSSTISNWGADSNGNGASHGRRSHHELPSRGSRRHI